MIWTALLATVIGLGILAGCWRLYTFVLTVKGWASVSAQEHVLVESAPIEGEAAS